MKRVHVEVMENFQGDELLVTVFYGSASLRRRISLERAEEDPPVVKRTIERMIEEITAS